MGSIATTRGDSGETSLVGGVRQSKAAPRVDAYGNVDELIASLGFARSISADEEIDSLTERIQCELFQVGAALATPAESRTPAAPIAPEMVDRLTAEVHRLEALPGLTSDWSVPGRHAAGAAFDLARTVCRRAERRVVGLLDSGEPIEPLIVAYLNRLSDLLWLIGRKLELEAGVNGSLRAITGKAGNRWSRAW
jgi:cob(I)alamin adenosyltransferase